ncbi:MAG TPA: AMP-binding protein, partial [Methylomirabilota bacterium]|nr:AMP-binding protein [Methylomirabilota bacterium]
MQFQTRLTPALIERYTRSGHWGRETFYDILARRAQTHPDREAIVDHRHRVTYRQVVERVDRTAAALGQLGIGAGDVITIQLPNWVEFAYVFFACER